MNRIGGSDVAAILGFSPYATPFDVWMDLQHGRRNDGNATTDRGNRLEPVLLDWYNDNYNPIISRQVEVEGPLPWMGGHLDALASTDRIVEAKTDARNTWAPNGTVVEKWPDTSESPVPAYYASQAYWYLEIAGGRALDFVVLTGRLEFRVVTLLPDPVIQTRIRAKVEAWYQRHVVDGITPDLDWSDAARRHATVMPAGKALRSPSIQEVQTIQEYALLGVKIKGLEQRRKALGTAILGALGTDYGMDLGSDAKVIAPSVKGRTTYDLKQLEKDHPGLLANYAKTGEPTRQVRTYGLGDNDDE
jgi:putative phage-type endonuclease